MRRPPRRRKRIWVQHVAVETDKLRLRLDAARARADMNQYQRVLAGGIYAFLDKARDAAFRDDPIPGRWANWWRGTLVEAAYRNLHAARAQMVDLYDRNQLRAEIPQVVARANATLHRDDPRRITVEGLEAESVESLRPRMRRVIADSYEQLDLEHAQLRSFRNILFIAAFFVIVLLAATLVVVGLHPNFMPLCFPHEVTDAQDITRVTGLNCPAGEGLDVPQRTDILIVALVGALGGSLAATLSIRNLKGTSTPYDIPVALAILKVPLGALTAILALVAIQGKFVPGLSVLDSQGQILAYALVFGFAQQALSRLLDRQAQNLLEGLPGGTATEPTPPGSGTLQKPPPGTDTVGQAAPPEAGAAAEAPAEAETPPTSAKEPEGAEPTEDGEPTGGGAAEPEVIEEAPVPAPLAEEAGLEEVSAVEPVVEGPQAEAGVPVAAEEGEGRTEAGEAAATAGDRPVQEPEDASQENQLDLLRETGNERMDMDEEEEGHLLQEEFGSPDEHGIYGAPPQEEEKA